ncbi:hypothetical protein EZS27_004599 [termite gut metagenome]|uniref:Uncharacterized protein n=1 Tax=termite gut metagenome TaxID=433724 RepID=A0A5J4SPF8_9ZZZZ
MRYALLVPPANFLQEISSIVSASSTNCITSFKRGKYRLGKPLASLTNCLVRLYFII